MKKKKSWIWIIIIFFIIVVVLGIFLIIKYYPQEKNNKCPNGFVMQSGDNNWCESPKKDFECTGKIEQKEDNKGTPIYVCGREFFNGVYYDYKDIVKQAIDNNLTVYIKGQEWEGCMLHFDLNVQLYAPCSDGSEFFLKNNEIDTFRIV